MNKKKSAQLEKELNAINQEFHQVIDQKKHCYERTNGDEHCDCEYYYKKWVDTKKEYGL